MPKKVVIAYNIQNQNSKEKYKRADKTGTLQKLEVHVEDQVPCRSEYPLCTVHKCRIFCSIVIGKAGKTEDYTVINNGLTIRMKYVSQHST